MLKTAFPRPPGDVGNPATWPCATLYKVVEGAAVSSVVTAEPLPEDLIAGFIEAGRGLVDQGATLVTTSCGFLVTAQAALEAALPVPVMTSSLLQIAELQAGLAPGARVGVITFDADKLTPAHLEAAGAAADTPVVGLDPGGELTRVISRDLPKLDGTAAEAELLDAGRRLVGAAPNLGAVVLECTNLPPYRAALSRALGLPVHDLVTLISGRLDAERVTEVSQRKR